MFLSFGAWGFFWRQSFAYAKARCLGIAVPWHLPMSRSSMTVYVCRVRAIWVTQLSLSVPRGAGHTLRQRGCVVGCCSSSALLTYLRIARRVRVAEQSVSFVPPTFCSSELVRRRLANLWVCRFCLCTSRCIASPRYACSSTSATALIGPCIRVGGGPSLAHFLRLVNWWGLPCLFAFIRNACEALCLFVRASAWVISKSTRSVRLARMVSCGKGVGLPGAPPEPLASVFGCILVIGLGVSPYSGTGDAQGFWCLLRLLSVLFGALAFSPSVDACAACRCIAAPGPSTSLAPIRECPPMFRLRGVSLDAVITLLACPLSAGASACVVVICDSGKYPTGLSTLISLRTC